MSLSDSVPPIPEIISLGPSPLHKARPPPVSNYVSVHIHHGKARPFKARPPILRADPAPAERSPPKFGSQRNPPPPPHTDKASGLPYQWRCSHTRYFPSITLSVVIRILLRTAVSVSQDHLIPAQLWATASPTATGSSVVSVVLPPLLWQNCELLLQTAHPCPQPRHVARAYRTPSRGACTPSRCSIACDDAAVC